ncbi:MAG: polysaccharide biosynthesis C-terminal domain-containing protein [Chryseosolibacter sp.]
MGKIQRLAGETVLYGLGSIVPRFLSFLLVPLHTDVFSPEEYGVITKVYAYVGVVNIVFIFGMETAYFRFASKAGLDERKVFNLAQTVVITISTLLSLGFILLASPISEKLSVPGHHDLVMWIILIMFIDACVAIPFARLRLQKKALRFAAGKLINIGLLVGLNLFLLKFSPALIPDVSFVILANLAANAFYLLFFAPVLLSWRPAYDKNISPAMYGYAYPVMFTGLAGMTNEMFSRITLEEWLPAGFYGEKSDEYALGIFGACYKLAALMNLAIQAFRYAAEPFFFSNASEKNSPQLFATVNHYFIIVCCTLLLGVAVNLDILKYFLADPAYWEGLHIVPILLLAYLFLGVYYNFSVWFKLTDKTYFGTLTTVIGMVITIVGNYILIPIAGYEGSAIAALLCYSGMTVLCYVLGQRFYPIPYNIVRAIVYIGGTMALVYVVNSIPIENQVAATAFHMAMILAYLIVVYLIEGKGLRLKRA